MDALETQEDAMEMLRSQYNPFKSTSNSTLDHRPSVLGLTVVMENWISWNVVLMASVSLSESLWCVSKGRVLLTASDSCDVCFCTSNDLSLCRRSAIEILAEFPNF